MRVWITVAAPTVSSMVQAVDESTVFVIEVILLIPPSILPHSIGCGLTYSGPQFVVRSLNLECRLASAGTRTNRSAVVHQDTALGNGVVVQAGDVEIIDFRPFDANRQARDGGAAAGPGEEVIAEAEPFGFGPAAAVGFDGHLSLVDWKCLCDRTLREIHAGREPEWVFGRALDRLS